MKKYEHTPYQSAFGPIFRINARLLFSSCLTFAGWQMWPDSASKFGGEYGWGFLAICLFGAALGLLIEAIKEMTKLYVRDREIEIYMAQGNKPDAAEFVTDKTLTGSEMIDD